MDFIYTLINFIKTSPVLLNCISVILILILLSFLWSLFKKWQCKKYKVEQIPWVKIIEDAKLTLYDWCDTDKKWYMSLPRMAFMVSIILVIYCVIANQFEMIAEITAFSLGTMAAYSGKKYFDSKKDGPIAPVLEKIEDVLESFRNNDEETENIEENTEENSVGTI